jgi:hypothetical protein
MQARWPFLALIIALLAIGSLLPGAGGAMELQVAVAGMVDMDMPDCDACDDPPATCDFGCTSAQMALAAFPDNGPMRAAYADRHAVTHTRLVGIAGPPDTAPPRSS